MDAFSGGLAATLNVATSARPACRLDLRVAQRMRGAVGFKGQCSRCGWTTNRKLENMKRPCPKCGGAIYVHQDDRGVAATYLVVVLVGMLFLVILYSWAGIAKW